MSTDGLVLKLADLFVQLLWAACGRPRVSVRIQDDKPEQEIGGLRVEVTNHRWTVTSLDPKIKVIYHYVEDGRLRRGCNLYYVRELDRRLEPHLPKCLTASADRRPKHYWLSFFRTYTFHPTGGLKTRIRVRDPLLEALSLPRFVWEFTRFIWSKKLYSNDLEDYEDYKRKKRARGPH